MPLPLCVSVCVSYLFCQTIGNSRCLVEILSTPPPPSTGLYKGRVRYTPRLAWEDPSTPGLMEVWVAGLPNPVLACPVTLESLLDLEAVRPHVWNGEAGCGGLVGGSIACGMQRETRPCCQHSDSLHTPVCNQGGTAFVGFTSSTADEGAVQSVAAWSWQFLGVATGNASTAEVRGRGPLSGVVAVIVFDGDVATVLEEKASL